MNITLDTRSMDDYRLFLKIKALPKYTIHGKTADVPDEYAAELGMAATVAKPGRYRPSPFLFDYQRDIAKLAIKKKKFSLFADCGLGKTLIYSEFGMHAARQMGKGKAVLIISPLMVVQQTLDEYERWYGGRMKMEQVSAHDLPAWLEKGGQFGITNFEALRDDVQPGRLGCLIVDESSMLKSHYGAWGRTILRLGKGLEWKMAGTGTPAPNDRIEYANHAVFMDAFPNVNAFLARYFVNRGQKAEKWALKPHALAPFYRSLSHWSIFLANPSTYGWHDHATDIPPIHVHIERVPLTTEQQSAIQDTTGTLLVTHAGGIGMRGKLGQISKGSHKGEKIATNKPTFIRRLVEQWPREQTIIWCIYNAEQEQVAHVFDPAVIANISGATPFDERAKLLAEFRSGQRRVLITKPKILGFGLNLQCATRQVFSGLQDSYEQYYQAVKRSNRVGSTRPLNVHIPVTDAEIPMVETVLEKADRVQKDTDEQERIFKTHDFNTNR